MRFGTYAADLHRDISDVIMDHTTITLDRARRYEMSGNAQVQPWPSVVSLKARMENDDRPPTLNRAFDLLRRDDVQKILLAHVPDIGGTPKDREERAIPGLELWQTACENAGVDPCSTTLDRVLPLAVEFIQVEASGSLAKIGDIYPVSRSWDAVHELIGD